MTYVAAEARQELLDALSPPIDRIGEALAALGAAYEQLDDYNAGQLEEQLFGPVQRAYGRAKRTYDGFAQRHELTGRAFTLATSGHPSQGVKGFLEASLTLVGEADDAFSALQDSMLPVEVGDPELRAGLSEVRRLLSGLRPVARRFVAGLGR